jgi:hypothetical protein
VSHAFGQKQAVASGKPDHRAVRAGDFRLPVQHEHPFVPGLIVPEAFRGGLASGDDAFKTDSAAAQQGFK